MKKMKIDDFMRRIPNNGNIDENRRGKKLFKKKFKYSPFELTINTKFPLYDTYENKYEVLGGMIVGVNSKSLTNNNIKITT